MNDVKPLNFFQSVVLFGLSALLFRLCVYGLFPWLLTRGLMEFWAFILSYSLPLSVMIGTTFALVRNEGNLQHWRTRLRLNRITSKEIVLCIGLFVVGFLLTGLLLPTARYIASIQFLSPPSFLPDILNPNKTIPGQHLENFMGVTLKGSYWVVVVYFFFLTFLNIMGEEFWFRGYILPRQELFWGKKTWIYHGMLWSLFYFPIYPWTIIYLLPTTLTVSYASQKFRSTWGGFIIHYLGNGVLALLPLIRGVFF